MPECARGTTRDRPRPKTNGGAFGLLSRRERLMRTSTLTRRRFLATSAASTAMVAMPHVRGAHAAGKLSVGLWDHWVPTANAASTALIEEWAAS